MRQIRPTVTRILAAGALALAAGCASSGQMRPDAIARLERAAAARPDESSIARNLGIAYYKAGRYADARAQLDRAVRLDPRDGTAALFLGLTAEQQQDLPAARAAYQGYVQHGRTSRVRRQLEARLAALNRQAIQVAARAAVQQEQQLSAQAGSPKTVAVMPLRFVGSDSSLQPLERGLAELITIDLARSHELTVVERERLQAILGELALQSSGETDSMTNVRAGRVIQAGSIVSGQIAQDEQRLRVDAAVVNTSTAEVAGGAASEDALAQVFDIEKELVLQLFDTLGVRLTTAERNAIEQRPTRSLQAFLAYSRGLAFEDQGQYDEASRSFQEAVRIDPGFSQAQTKSNETASIAQGAQMTTASIESGLAGTSEGATADQAAQGEGASNAGGTAEEVANSLNSSQSQDATDGAGGTESPSTTAPPKDASGAGLGGGDPGSGGTVKIVIRIPHP